MDFMDLIWIFFGTVISVHLWILNDKAGAILDVLRSIQKSDSKGEVSEIKQQLEFLNKRIDKASELLHTIGLNTRR